MGMNRLEWVCPACAHRNSENANTWCYGSPIRTCAKCGEEYLERRWREPAVEGFDPRTVNAGFYSKGLLVFIAFAVLAGAYTWYTIHFKGYYSMKMAMVCGLGVLGVVLCLVMLIGIKTGAVAKRQAPFMEQSIQRMHDPAYVRKLKAYGYRIPKEYDVPEE